MWNKMIQKGKGLFKLIRNDRGTVLMEKKILLVVIVVGVFGFSGLGYTFLKDYWNQTSTNIKNNSQINEEVSW
ncbi:hypothetical protein P9302_00685 [Brevibacillus agri]|jgi:hypothetical protein|uniref:Uncharacterized protein n=1 Tax=Brevibacillus brevis TaxID=1393 RepID=A0ABY9SZD5_BREBE|nr:MULTISPECIES: hypothetical protein [Brevibacillus]MCG5254129.1 hypothetical protein [Brevibacillus agri]MED4568002.1 hypothetical protein [Brevibacillus agri]WNC13083.1 hypothetical protein RGB73_20495 [Brevibacillus brevis]